MKALVGSWDNRPYRLLAEITALRTRVRELEGLLAQAHAEGDALRDQNAALRAKADADDFEVALSSN